MEFDVVQNFKQENTFEVTVSLRVDAMMPKTQSVWANVHQLVLSNLMLPQDSQYLLTFTSDDRVCVRLNGELARENWTIHLLTPLLHSKGLPVKPTDKLIPSRRLCCPERRLDEMTLP